MEELVGGGLGKALVTGATGSIGRAVVALLAEQGVQTIAVVRPGSDTRGIGHLPGMRVVRCGMDDVERLPEVVRDRDIDVCLHLAWEGTAGPERAYPTMQLRNVWHSVELVSALSRMGVRRFVGAGTLAEVDVLAYHPTDGATPNLTSHYGSAKLAAHFMTKAECSSAGVEHVWCRLANTYGPGVTAGNFVTMATRTMLEGRRAAFTTGEQTYDFVYLTDTARAICLCAGKGVANCGYYLGSGEPRRLRDYIRSIRDAVDPSIELFLGEIPFNGTPLPPEAYDASRLREDTGFVPEVPFEEGISMTVEWMRGLAEA